MRNEADDVRIEVVDGDIFDALGFTPAEASALRFKARILSALQRRIRAKKYTQKQLAALLDEHQPSVSNLVNGKISRMSLEKLLGYADRLGIALEVVTKQRRRSRRRAASNAA